MSEVSKQASSELINIFISYTSRDKKFYDQLYAHLRVLEYNNIIHVWKDEEIPAGERGRYRTGTIDTHLADSQLILILVSADYLASDYLYEGEMKRALELHERGQARVLPIVVRDCNWERTPLRGLALLPHNQKPVDHTQDVGNTFEGIVQDIRVICNEIRTYSELPSTKIKEDLPVNKEEESSSILSKDGSPRENTPIAKSEVNTMPESTPTPTPIVFISYSHLDDKEDNWVGLLVPFLRFVEQTFVEQDSSYESSIKSWSDKNLRVGSHWHEEIQKQIASTAYAILLVSTNFLVSDYINKWELPQLLKREEEGKTVILPVIIGHCEYKESKLKHLESINEPDEPLLGMDRNSRQRVMRDLAREIRKYLKGD